MANLGWLNKAITRPEGDGWALILVDHPDPALVAEDQLEPDRMVVDLVRDGARIGNPDVRGEESIA